MGRNLYHDLCIPCVVQWSMLWFSAPTRLNHTMEDDELKNRTVPMAITENATQRLGCDREMKGW